MHCLEQPRQIAEAVIVVLKTEAEAPEEGEEGACHQGQAEHQGGGGSVRGSEQAPGQLKEVGVALHQREEEVAEDSTSLEGEVLLQL